jgi:hypothetical protein
VVTMAMIVLRYKITVKEEKRFVGETFEERKERVLRARPGVSQTWVFLVILVIHALRCAKLRAPL